MKSAEAIATDSPTADPTRSPTLRRWTDSNLEVLSLIAGLLLWEAAGWLLGFPWLPPFSTVMFKLVELFTTDNVATHLVTSLTNLAVGVALALGIGLPLGALMGRFKWIDQALSVYVYAFFVAPVLVFVPVFFAIFGLASGTIVAVIFMYTVFVIIINTRTAVKGVDRSLTEMARSYGATEFSLFFRVVIPASLPLVFAGIQLGIGRGVKGMINGEMFIALVGLGAVSQRFSGRFEAEGALAIAILILLVAIALNFLIRKLDTTVNYWTYN